DKIAYRIIPDYTAALTALKAGEIDVQPRLMPIQYKEQTSGSAFDQRFAKMSYSITSRFQIFWNYERPFVEDQREHSCRPGPSRGIYVRSPRERIQPKSETTSLRSKAGGRVARRSRLER